jgi:hypothetical protein
MAIAPQAAPDLLGERWQAIGPSRPADEEAGILHERDEVGEPIRGHSGGWFAEAAVIRTEEGQAPRSQDAPGLSHGEGVGAWRDVLEDVEAGDEVESIVLEG